jgi:hypothetical protein
MSAYQSQWPTTASTSSASSSFGTGSANVDGASNAFALPILHTLSDAHSNEDEYEDGDELGDLPALAASGGSTKHSERSIRRRSSKGVCDSNPPPPLSRRNHFYVPQPMLHPLRYVVLAIQTLTLPRYSMRPVPEVEMQVREAKRERAVQKLCSAEHACVFLHLISDGVFPLY